MSRDRESLHGWSLATAIIGLAAIALWLLWPDLLSPRVMIAAHAAWAVGVFGSLFVRIHGHRRWADRVTAVRVILCVILFAAYVLEPSAAWWKVAVAVAVILLDGIDGALARRRDGPTEHGAVFDMESDAFYIVTMCGIAYLHLGVTPFVFVIGALRPLYVCTWAVLQLLVAPPSPNHEGSHRGRVVHLAVVIALIVDLAPWFPISLKDWVTAAAVLFISYSYAVDILASLRSTDL